MTNLTNKLYKYIKSLKLGSFNHRITDRQTTIRLLMGFFIAASLVWGWSDLNPVFLDFYFQSGVVNCTGNRNPDIQEWLPSDYLKIVENYKGDPNNFHRWMQHQLMPHSPDKRNYFIMHIKMQESLHFIINDWAATLTQSERQCIHKILTQHSFKYRECYLDGHDLLIKHVELLQTVAQVTPTPSPQHWGYCYGQYLLGTVVLGIGIYLGWGFLKPLAQELCSAIGRS